MCIRDSVYPVYPRHLFWLAAWIDRYTLDPTAYTSDDSDVAISECTGVWVISSYPVGGNFTDTVWYQVRLPQARQIQRDDDLDLCSTDPPQETCVCARCCAGSVY